MKELIEYINQFSMYPISSYTINEKEKIIRLNFQPMDICITACVCEITDDKITFKTEDLVALKAFRGEVLMELARLDILRKEITQYLPKGIDVDMKDYGLVISFTDTYIKRTLDDLTQITRKLLGQVCSVWIGQGTLQGFIEKMRFIPNGRYINHIEGETSNE